MERFNFGSFLVTDSNREAFQACKDVADLKPLPRRPVILVGSKGCGKTHLLYSVVNQVRADGAETGLAYIMASKFPKQVRAVIEDPTGVQEKESAILLVDQLDKFTDYLEELEGVVRIFLDANHHVVLASSVHPARLTNISEGLWNLLGGGQVVHIKPQATEAQIELIRHQARQEVEERLRLREKEIERLKLTVEQAGGGAPEPLSLAELAEARSRIDRLESEKRAAEENCDALRARLTAAQQEGEAARQEANELLQKAEGLLEQIESNRTAFAEKEKEQQERIDELEAELTTLRDGSGVVELAETKAMAEQLTQQMAEAEAEAQQEREALERRLAEAMNDLDTARKAGAEAEEREEALTRNLEQAGEAKAGLESRLDEQTCAAESFRQQVSALEQQVADREAELDSLRHEAAAQVAEAHAQAGELERRVAVLEETLARLCRKSRETGGSLQNLGEELTGAALAIAEMAGKLVDAADLATSDAANGGRGDGSSKGDPLSALVELDTEMGMGDAPEEARSETGQSEAAAEPAGEPAGAGESMVYTDEPEAEGPDPASTGAVSGPVPENAPDEPKAEDEAPGNATEDLEAQSEPLIFPSPLTLVRPGDDAESSEVDISLDDAEKLEDPPYSREAASAGPAPQGDAGLNALRTSLSEPPTEDEEEDPSI